MNSLATRKYKWRGNKQQRSFIEYWLTPESGTYGNAYKSAIKAGFSRTYALNLTGQAPKWLSENLEKVDFQPEHIKQGIQQLAINAQQSKSPDDTRLRAYELLAKILGILDTKQTTNVTLVQPILSGASVKEVIDQEPESR